MRSGITGGDVCNAWDVRVAAAEFVEVAVKVGYSDVFEADRSVELVKKTC